jgi:hypothetical protein
VIFLIYIVLIKLRYDNCDFKKASKEEVQKALQAVDRKIKSSKRKKGIY